MQRNQIALLHRSADITACNCKCDWDAPRCEPAKHDLLPLAQNFRIDPPQSANPATLVGIHPGIVQADPRSPPTAVELGKPAVDSVEIVPGSSHQIESVRPFRPIMIERVHRYIDLSDPRIIPDQRVS